jgi:hypothetical protein
MPFRQQVTRPHQARSPDGAFRFRKHLGRIGTVDPPQWAKMRLSHSKRRRAEDTLRGGGSIGARMSGGASAS